MTTYPAIKYRNKLGLSTKIGLARKASNVFEKT